MFRLFKHYVPYAVLFLALIDMGLLLFAADAAWVARARQIGMAIEPIGLRYWPLINFARAPLPGFLGLPIARETLEK